KHFWKKKRVLREIWKSLNKRLMKIRDLLKRCGAAAGNVKKKLKKRRQLHPAVFHLSRKEYLTPVYAAEKKPKNWFIGQKHIRSKKRALEVLVFLIRSMLKLFQYPVLCFPALSVAHNV